MGAPAWRPLFAADSNAFRDCPAGAQFQSMSSNLDQLLSSYSPETQELAMQARSLILKTIPKLQEQVDLPGKLVGYGFSSKYADTICVIMPAKAWVTLGIGRASELPDPSNLLEGKGKVHRHVKLRTAADVNAPALRQLLRAAFSAYKKRSKQID
jgi:hypothetical protein